MDSYEVALDAVLAAAREVAAMSPYDVYLGELRAALSALDEMEVP
jgi:hypothetical protein